MQPEGVICRLQVAGAGCRLQVAGCRLQVAGCRWQVVGCRLQVIIVLLFADVFRRTVNETKKAIILCIS